MRRRKLLAKTPLVRKLLNAAIATAVMAAAIAQPVRAEEPETETSQEAAGKQAEMDANGSSMTIACAYDEEDLNPGNIYQYSESVIAKLLYPTLRVLDRNGNLVTSDGYTSITNGTQYSYHTIADVTRSYIDSVTTQDGVTTPAMTQYSISLHDGVTFSDGTPLTVDDVIFSYYFYLDKSMEDKSALQESGIVGHKEYRENNTAADALGIHDEEIEYYMLNPDEYMQQKLTAWITNKIHEEAKHAEAVYQEFGYQSPQLILKDSYSLDPAYTVQGKEMSQVESEIAWMYGYDYLTFSEMAEGDRDAYHEEIKGIIRQCMVDEILAAHGGEPVSSVIGIQRDGEKELRVIAIGPDYGYKALDIPILSLSWYGNKELYSEENGLYGVTRGDVYIAPERAVEPVGAGAYKYIGKRNGDLVFEANYQYYAYAPQTRYIILKQASEDAGIRMVQSGQADMCQISNALALNTAFQDINGNGLSGYAVDENSFGYIGLNMDRMCVSYDPDSEASRNLRKAFCTIFAAMRYEAYTAWFGNMARVLETPLPYYTPGNPQAGDAGYSQAYAVDIDGNYLYPSDIYGSMSYSDMYNAAANAALGYFAAAGYTVENGKVVKAPDGAKLVYNAIIPAGTQGRHPSYQALSMAKQLLSQLGIQLQITDTPSADLMWDFCEQGKAEIWCAAYSMGAADDLTPLFSSAGSENFFHVKSEEIDRLLMMRGKQEGTEKAATTQQVIEEVMRRACIVGGYGRVGYVVVNPNRIAQQPPLMDMSEWCGWEENIGLETVTAKPYD